MNRQWMYGDRHTREYIKGVHEFLDAAEANKQNGFMCCPCTECGNTRSYSNRKILHSHLLYKGFMPHYNVWMRHGEIGVMMEDDEEEEEEYLELEVAAALAVQIQHIEAGAPTAAQSKHQQQPQSKQVRGLLPPLLLLFSLFFFYFPFV